MSNKDDEKIYLNLQRVPLKSEREEKKKKRRFVLLNFSVFLILICSGFILGLLFNKVQHPTKNADTRNTLGEIEAVLEHHWLYSADYDDLQSELEDKAFYGMTNFEDDPYTTYMSKQEMEDFAKYINMDYVGIGVVYVLQGDYPLVERVIINSPAEKAGIKTGDIITHVDGETVSGLDTAQIKERVIGIEGTPVTITVLRDNEHQDIEIIRGAVDNSVYCYAKDDYVLMDLYSFGEATGKDCISYLDQYTDYNKIIINLRDNSGGYQSAASELCGLFIGDNKVYLKQADSGGNFKESLTSCRKTYSNFDKIVILVNENTASAAEVFVICLKEQLDNVTVVGTTTYGKGVIQSTHYLANGGALKYTSYNWYSPSGKSINGTGIEPDIEIKQADVYYERYEAMEDDEKLEIDCVDSRVKTAQMCLNLLGYYGGRKDGYFNRELAEAIEAFRAANNINKDNILDKQTYDCLISKTISALAEPENDRQMLRAIQIINE